MISEGHRDKKKGVIAMVVGTILLLIGLLLTVADIVVYVGEWPDQRPVYLAGIGYPLFVIGIFSALTGLYFYLAEPKSPATPETEVGGKEPD